MAAQDHPERQHSEEHGGHSLRPGTRAQDEDGGGQQKIELLFDAERPGLRQGIGPGRIDEQVLGEGQELPRRLKRAAVPQDRKGEIERGHDQVSRKGPEKASCEKLG